MTPNLIDRYGLGPSMAPNCIILECLGCHWVRSPKPPEGLIHKIPIPGRVPGIKRTQCTPGSWVYPVPRVLGLQTYQQSSQATKNLLYLLAIFGHFPRHKTPYPQSKGLIVEELGEVRKQMQAKCYVVPQICQLAKSCSIQFERKNAPQGKVTMFPSLPAGHDNAGDTLNLSGKIATRYRDRHR